MVTIDSCSLRSPWELDDFSCRRRSTIRWPKNSCQLAGSILVVTTVCLFSRADRIWQAWVSGDLRRVVLAR